jgi:biopolymer transport protein ExbD
MGRKVQEINAGSMADIAFLLLIFFLVTTTMDSDFGIARLLPPLEEENVITEINERNVLVVNVNFRNDMQVGGEVIALPQLKGKVKEFFDNPNNNPKLSDKKKDVEIPFFGKRDVSKGVISLTNDMGTQYKTYLRIQDELTTAINELRDKISKEKFGKIYDKLGEKQQEAVKMIYPMAISEAEPKNAGGRP